MHMRQSAAFTLMEILVVLFIIGFLLAFIGPRIYRRIAQSNVAVTKLTMQKIKNALIEYKQHVGHFPNKKEGGLRALIERPTIRGVAEKWQGPYLDSEDDLQDKWGYDFEFNVPPQRDNNLRFFEIVSFGADGLEGGEGENQEIYIGI